MINYIEATPAGNIALYEDSSLLGLGKNPDDIAWIILTHGGPAPIIRNRSLGKNWTEEHDLIWDKVCSIL
jgi:hypothetical protein